MKRNLAAAFGTKGPQVHEAHQHATVGTEDPLPSPPHNHPMEDEPQEKVQAPQLHHAFAKGPNHPTGFASKAKPAMKTTDKTAHNPVSPNAARAHDSSPDDAEMSQAKAFPERDYTQEINDHPPLDPECTFDQLIDDIRASQRMRIGNKTSSKKDREMMDINIALDSPALAHLTNSHSYTIKLEEIQALFPAKAQPTSAGRASIRGNKVITISFENENTYTEAFVFLASTNATPMSRHFTFSASRAPKTKGGAFYLEDPLRAGYLNIHALDAKDAITTLRAQMAAACPKHNIEALIEASFLIDVSNATKSTMQGRVMDPHVFHVNMASTSLGMAKLLAAHINGTTLVSTNAAYHQRKPKNPGTTLTPVKVKHLWSTRPCKRCNIVHANATQCNKHTVFVEGPRIHPVHDRKIREAIGAMAPHDTEVRFQKPFASYLIAPSSSLDQPDLFAYLAQQLQPFIDKGQIFSFDVANNHDDPLVAHCKRCGKRDAFHVPGTTALPKWCKDGVCTKPKSIAQQQQPHLQSLNKGHPTNRAVKARASYATAAAATTTTTASSSSKATEIKAPPRNKRSLTTSPEKKPAPKKKPKTPRNNTATTTKKSRPAPKPKTTSSTKRKAKQKPPSTSNPTPTATPKATSAPPKQPTNAQTRVPSANAALSALYLAEKKAQENRPCCVRCKRNDLENYCSRTTDCPTAKKQKEEKAKRLQQREKKADAFSPPTTPASSSNSFAMLRHLDTITEANTTQSPSRGDQSP